MGKTKIVAMEMRLCTGSRFYIVGQVFWQIGMLINQATFFPIQHLPKIFSASATLTLSVASSILETISGLA